MQQTGIVKEIYHDRIGQKASAKSAEDVFRTADVEIVRSSSCGESCASCGLCPGKKALVSAINEAGAVVGDQVILETADKKVLGAAFLVYIVPLVMLLVGYFAGSASFGSETFGILTGFLAMAFTFIVLKLIDKNMKTRYMPRIVRIIAPEDREGASV